MTTAIADNWAQTRQKIRSLENQTEALFQTYAHLQNNPAPQPTPEETQTTTRLESLFDEREALNATLNRILDSQPNTSTTKLQNLLRHREILTEHRREYTRISSSIATARSRANLTQSVRNDISAYHSAQDGGRDRTAEIEEEEYMLGERGRLEDSLAQVDSVISRAYEVNDSLTQQRIMLNHVGRRIQSVAGRIPGINKLMEKINTRKRRDSVILAVLIAFCVLLIWWMR
ncbi:V-snare-domain-containing protein [Ascobolus immersus RN42]|uniref:Golgi SNAP receptor complex member 1 n=1 Tax=Ascobolus immersus RN42 TaxID=1160509 RepID=A0A3N4IKR1_ASCIM|nr:V-snare-domain-containing protein [Ascobolus immersus RN42]